MTLHTTLFYLYIKGLSRTNAIFFSPAQQTMQANDSPLMMVNSLFPGRVLGASSCSAFDKIM